MLFLEFCGRSWSKRSVQCSVQPACRQQANRPSRMTLRSFRTRQLQQLSFKSAVKDFRTRRRFMLFALQCLLRIIDRFKAKVRELTRRNQSRPVEYMLLKLRQYTMGWLGYYAIADMKNLMQRSTEWLRRKIRTYFWKQWKRVRTKFERLQSCGIERSKAWEWANTRKGYWHIADSWILHRALTNQRIAQMGYDDILTRYNALHSSC